MECSGCRIKRDVSLRIIGILLHVDIWKDANVRNNELLVYEDQSNYEVPELAKRPFLVNEVPFSRWICGSCIIFIVDFIFLVLNWFIHQLDSELSLIPHLFHNLLCLSTSHSFKVFNSSLFFFFCGIMPVKAMKAIFTILISLSTTASFLGSNKLRVFHFILI